MARPDVGTGAHFGVHVIDDAADGDGAGHSHEAAGSAQHELVERDLVGRAHPHTLIGVHAVGQVGVAATALVDLCVVADLGRGVAVDDRHADGAGDTSVDTARAGKRHVGERFGAVGLHDHAVGGTSREGAIALDRAGEDAGVAGIARTLGVDDHVGADQGVGGLVEQADAHRCPDACAADTDAHAAGDHGHGRIVGGQHDHIATGFDVGVVADGGLGLVVDSDHAHPAAEGERAAGRDAGADDEEFLLRRGDHGDVVGRIHGGGGAQLGFGGEFDHRHIHTRGHTGRAAHGATDADAHVIEVTRRCDQDGLSGVGAAGDVLVDLRVLTDGGRGVDVDHVDRCGHTHAEGAPCGQAEGHGLHVVLGRGRHRHTAEVRVLGCGGGARSGQAAVVRQVVGAVVVSVLVGHAHAHRRPHFQIVGIRLVASVE